MNRVSASDLDGSPELTANPDSRPLARALDRAAKQRHCDPVLDMSGAHAASHTLRSNMHRSLEFCHAITVESIIQCPAVLLTLGAVLVGCGWRGEEEPKAEASTSSGAALAEQPRKEMMISSFEELVALQDASNVTVTMKPDVYQIDSKSKSAFPGGEWPVDHNQAWPAMLNFTGSNNTFIMDGVTFQFDSTVLGEMPTGLGTAGQLNWFGGENNVWQGFTFEEVPGEGGRYGSWPMQQGGGMFVFTGKNNKLIDVTLRIRYSSPYGVGSIYGKTYASGALLPGVGLYKKEALTVRDSFDSTIDGLTIRHSALGHAMAFQEPISGLVIGNTTIEGETRSTDDLLDEGIAGSDRYMVPFNVEYKNCKLEGDGTDNCGGDEKTGGNTAFLSWFDTNNLNQCNDSGDHSGPIRRGYQFSLIEDGFRGYGADLGIITICNSSVEGARSGLAYDDTKEPTCVRNLRVRGVAGHGYPSCAGRTDSEDGGEGDRMAFNPPSGSVILDSAADAAYVPIINLAHRKPVARVLADLELLDPEDGYHRPPESTALALLSGPKHRVRIWKADGNPLQLGLVVKVGKHETDGSLICNMTPQTVELSSNVTNSHIYSIGPVEGVPGPGNVVVSVPDLAHEPDPCKMVATGLSEVKAQTVKWNMELFLAGSGESGFTADCGWFGCRVAHLKAVDDIGTLSLGPGGQAPTAFHLQPADGSPPEASCVRWNDRVALASHGPDGSRSYAHLDLGGNSLEFGPGAAGLFHVRPPPASRPREGCVQTGDQVVLAFPCDPAHGECVVRLSDDRSHITVGPGGEAPIGLFLRSWDDALHSKQALPLPEQCQQRPSARHLCAPPPP